MIEVVLGFNEPVADFVARNIPGCERGFENPVGMAVVEHEQLIAGVVFTNWQPEAGTIELHAAALSPRWFTLPVIRTIFRYVFNQLGCQMAILRVSANNSRMQSIAARLGFHGHVIPRLCGRDEDGVVYTLTDERWRSSRFERLN